MFFGTDLLVSLHHQVKRCYANFGIYSLSKQKCLFRFEGVIGSNMQIFLTNKNNPFYLNYETAVGTSDLSINSKRMLTALLPVEKHASYHLFDATCKKVIKKAKWHNALKGERYLY